MKTTRANPKTARKAGDVSRKRRLYGSEGLRAWYAYYRKVRFARRFGGSVDLDRLIHDFEG